MKCISHYHSPWEKTQGTDLQHVLSDFRALGVSLHQCRTSSSWGCISGGLLEKQRGHSETQPELQLSDQGALGGLGTALPAGHLGSWGSLGGDAPRGVLWAAPGKGSGFCCLYVPAEQMSYVPQLLSKHCSQAARGQPSQKEPAGKHSAKGQLPFPSVFN